MARAENIEVTLEQRFDGDKEVSWVNIQWTSQRRVQGKYPKTETVLLYWGNKKMGVDGWYR